MTLLRKHLAMSKIWRFLIGKGSAIAYAIVTAIFMIVPENAFNCVKICTDWSDTQGILINRLIVCGGMFVLSNCIYWCWRKKRKTAIVKGSKVTIQIEYANLMEIPSGKVIINFDECFTTRVGDAPGDVRAESVCGQYLKKNENLDIQELINNAGIKPAKGKSKYKGQTRYTPGTVIQNGNDLLMAFAKLDENGRGHLTYDEYLECLEKLWAQIDIYRGTDDIYVPILGSRITDFDKEFTQQELLDIMINSYSLSSKKIKEPNKLHIVCKERDGFSINDAFGVQ